MRIRPHILPLLILGIVAAGSFFSFATAQETSDNSFVVIVHAENPADELSREEVSRYFLKLQTKWENGKKVRPVDQKLGPIRETFSEAIHQRSMMAVKAEWTKRLFSGRATPPPQRQSDEEVIEYVRSHPDTIGYVSSSAALKGVKVLKIIF